MEILNKDLSLLISINDDIATIKDSQSLFLTIFNKLHDFYGLKIVGGAFFDKPKENLVFVIGKAENQKQFNNADLWTQTFSIGSLPFKISQTNQKVTSIDAAYFKQMHRRNDEQSQFTEVIREMGLEKFMLMPMKTGGELIGFLIFPSDEYRTDEKDDDYFQKIANLIGSAISSVNAYNELRAQEMEKEIQIRLLIDLVTIKERDVLYTRLASEVSNLIPCEYFAIHAEEVGMKLSKTFSLVKDDTNKFKITPLMRNVSLAISGLKSKVKEKEGQNYVEITGEQFDNMSQQFTYLGQLKEKHSIRSLIVFRYSYAKLGELNLILGRKNPFSVLNERKQIDILFSQNKNSFFAFKEIDLGMNLLPQLGMILGNLYAFEEIKILTRKLEQEKNYLLDEINLSNNFQEIIGNSLVIQSMLNKVQQVAPLDATVLVLGETGTGKELVAKAIHNLSKRKDNAFITINCAALPSQLIESELFGHEKGSFTGAIEKKIGKFEVANGGTIFLDEIGELPLEIQSKLLRVLQEKEFERLGGRSTIYSDVRIVAATNRDIEFEVKHGKFRADLFFRLNVFPIVSPPLRERTDDIPLLVKHFIEKYSKRIGKEVKSISKNDMDMLMQYNWPGNIRELEHLIERAMIISEGMNLSFEKLLGGSLRQPAADAQSFKPLIEIEKEHIIKALQLSLGKITGENSAAQLLGLNGKTLGSRMRKLGIKREVVITS